MILTMHALMMSVHFYPLKLRVGKVQFLKYDQPNPSTLLRSIAWNNYKYQLLYQSEYQAETSGAHTKIISKRELLMITDRNSAETMKEDNN